MMAEFEEQYLDVFQNIEAMIVDVYRQHQDLVDYDVEKALDLLIQTYKHPDRQPR